MAFLYQKSFNDVKIRHVRLLLHFIFSAHFFQKLTLKRRKQIEK